MASLRTPTYKHQRCCLRAEGRRSSSVHSGTAYADVTLVSAKPRPPTPAHLRPTGSVWERTGKRVVFVHLEFTDLIQALSSEKCVYLALFFFCPVIYWIESLCSLKIAPGI